MLLGAPVSGLSARFEFHGLGVRPGHDESSLIICNRLRQQLDGAASASERPSEVALDRSETFLRNQDPKPS